MALQSEILEDLDAAEGISADWDRLAVEAGRPYSAPAWALAWWRHCAPPEGELRLIAARDRDELVGVAPLWATKAGVKRAPYEFLGARLAAPTGPLAASGREPEVASSIADGLAELGPRPAALEFEEDAEDGWSGLLAEAWPRRTAWGLRRQTRPLPVISLDGLDFDGWLGRKSAKFRQRARRVRRRLEEQGALFGQVGADGFEEGLVAFERLHGARWQERGGSNALAPGLRPMIAEVAAAWLEAGRLRIFTLELEGEIAASWLLVEAGGWVDAWNTGFDDRWSRLSPAFQLMLYVVEDAAARGDAAICLGGGATEYKLRLADRVGALDRTTLLPRDAAYLGARLRLAPTQARRFASERLPDGAKSRLRGLGRRR
jgi:CelD/BcsL family acetyltransferase involved in cellulose biosynthesis